MKSVTIWQSKHSLSSSEYNISEENTNLYKCSVRYLSGSLKVLLLDPSDKELLSMKFALKEKNGLFSCFTKYEKNIHSITSGSITCGKICEVNIPFHTNYFKLVYNNYNLTADIIGLGTEGIKILVYNDREQIALIEHDVCRVQNINEYCITTNDDETLEFLSLFTVYYDRFYLNNPKHNNRKFSPTYCFTLSSNQRALYNPDWNDTVHVLNIDKEHPVISPFDDIINSDIEEEEEITSDAEYSSPQTATESDDFTVTQISSDNS